MKRLQETEQKIQRGEIKKNSPDYSGYVREDRSFAEALEANRKRRSKEAYNTSFLQ